MEARLTWNDDDDDDVCHKKIAFEYHPIKRWYDSIVRDPFFYFQWYPI